MTDTTNLPHSRACGMNCSGHGAACSKNCPTCAGNPDWTPDEPGAPDDPTQPASGRVRATIAVERLERLAVYAFRGVEWDSPATHDQLADVLEAMHGVVVDLQQRASTAETERDAYRQAIEGGRTWLGLVVPELVYPQRMVLPMEPPRPAHTPPPDPNVTRWDLCGREPIHGRHLGGSGDWNCTGLPAGAAAGQIWTLPPDPLTVLQQEVADLTAAVGRLADREQHPEPPRLACRADQFCEASEHYIACPAYSAQPSAGPTCRAPGCTLGGGHPSQHHPWHHDQAAYDRACRAHHPGELCKPGENHPGAN